MNDSPVSWATLDLEHLFFAYRKAKADCFFDRQVFIAERFVAFEENLYTNLTELLAALQAGNVEDLLKSNLGTPTLVAKKLGVTPSKKNGHGYFSSPTRAFEHLREHNTLTPEFRLVGSFPVVMYVLSALWINEVGHKLDAKLSVNAHASRLRRYRPLPGSLKNQPGEFHKLGLGSFAPYFGPYRNWRSNGLNAIRHELQENRPVIAMSLDLTSYYHNIDPTFIGLPGFWEELEVELNDWEQGFTKAFGSAMVEWGQMARAKIAQHTPKNALPELGGVPIGLPAIRLLANALLWKLDKAISEGLAPVYYGRYVDDIFLVMRDPECLKTSEEVMGYIRNRVPCLGEAMPLAKAKQGQPSIMQRTIDLGESYQGKTQLVLQDEKHKVFFLNAEGGLDLLDNIEKEITSVASERRLMPDPDTLDKTTAAKVLSAASSSAEEADTLRRADGLSVKRLGWSIQLRSVETLAKDLKSDDWKEQRLKFYTFAKNHVLRPDKLLDQIDYLPRLLSLAVSLQDWASAIELVETCKNAIQQLREDTKGAKVNGHTVSRVIGGLWSDFDARIDFSCQETFLRAYRWRKQQPTTLSNDARRLVKLIGFPEDVNIHLRALVLRESDWAKTAYKDHLKRDATAPRTKSAYEELIAAQYDRTSELKDFLRACEPSCTTAEPGKAHVRRTGEGVKGCDESLLPYLFPTRPYLAQEIALYIPECLFHDSLWASYVHAVRGSWVIPHLLEGDDGKKGDDGYSLEPKPLKIGKENTISDVRLGISSLLTTGATWAKGAHGPKPDVSPARYKRITGIINQALKVHPRPTYMLLPELALPERWIESVSSRLRESKINLIAGLDYHHHIDGLVESNAVLILADDRLGFSSPVQIRQRKEIPAPQEGHDLHEVYGKKWYGGCSAPKRLYSHNGFQFGVLICSELQNIGHRQRFQGNVDALMILAWNKDLETFSALIESAALDVHTYVALVNNREYGDSRVRAPAKHSFKRDLCRLKGGKNDYFVVVELDIKSLRAFQSRALSWPRCDSEKFKPVPEGFKLAPSRKAQPE
jgi:hypothetical protein